MVTNLITIVGYLLLFFVQTKDYIVKKLITIYYILIGQCFLSTVFAQIHEPSPKESGTIFIDLFNSINPIPDTKIWKLCSYANNVWSQHFKHVEKYENVKVEDGYLKLTADKKDGHYKNGGIRSIIGFPNNTRLEVKARLKKIIKGGFPAIWQMPVNGGEWPKSGEIDLMEWVQKTPNQIYQTVHSSYINQTNGFTGKTNPNPNVNFDVTKDHIYAAERTDKAVTFYVDGKETWRYENKYLNKEDSLLQFPFNKYDFDIILNYSLGGLLNGSNTWPGMINNSDLPGEMWIDWVRVINLNTDKNEQRKQRNLSSYSIVHDMLRHIQPKYAYKEGLSSKQFKKWQNNVQQAMTDLMNFPNISQESKPKIISTEKRDGYTLEKWEFYPFPNAVSTFLVLKPNHIKKTTPGVLCIPGSGKTKEELAGEKGICENLNEDYTNPKICMALDMVKAGYVAVAVDNAAAGEAADMDCKEQGNNYDYDIVSRFLLEMGWHWLGYTSYLNMQVLKWMKQQSYINEKRIVISGFSLGTEPMMVLGVLDKDIYAFVYNDFLCQAQERAIVMTKPNRNNRRYFPNSIRHLIPGYWNYFNFPDVVASLAPRHIIFTEGGLDRDLLMVKSAYQKAGKMGNMVYYHYPRYANPDKRKNLKRLPEDIDAKTFYHMVNVDPTNHYFKYEQVIPWLKDILK